MKIKYNSPTILTYAILSLGVLLFFTHALSVRYFSSPAHLSFSNPYFHLRSISYIAGHGGWGHLMGNLMIILLVGPCSKKNTAREKSLK